MLLARIWLCVPLVVMFLHSRSSANINYSVLYLLIFSYIQNVCFIYEYARFYSIENSVTLKTFLNTNEVPG
jgi:hypothetical protein